MLDIYVDFTLHVITPMMKDSGGVIMIWPGLALWYQQWW